MGHNTVTLVYKNDKVHFVSSSRNNANHYLKRMIHNTWAEICDQADEIIMPFDEYLKEALESYSFKDFDIK